MARTKSSSECDPVQLKVHTMDNFLHQHPVKYSLLQDVSRVGLHLTSSFLLEYSLIPKVLSTLMHAGAVSQRPRCVRRRRLDNEDSHHSRTVVML